MSTVSDWGGGGQNICNIPSDAIHSQENIYTWFLNLNYKLCIT